MWVGFSFAMCAQLYAMAENGAGAYEKLRQFADGFVEENGFHLNGDYKQKCYSTFHYRRFYVGSIILDFVMHYKRCIFTGISGIICI